MDDLAVWANSRFSRGPNDLVSSGDVRLGIQRLQGTFQHPAFLATFIAMVAPVAYGLLLRSRGRMRWLCAGTLGLAAAALVLSGTRAAWLATILGVGVVMLAAAAARRPASTEERRWSWPVS